MSRRGWCLRNKTLKYRDFTGRPREFHEAHWAGFEWQAGPFVVSYEGAHGCIQVWAVSEAEGRRVVEHACEAGGIPLSGPGAGEWLVSEAASARNGRPGTFQTARIDAIPVVTKRSGASGSPLISSPP